LSELRAASTANGRFNPAVIDQACRKWYVAETLARREEIAFQNLTRQHFQVFVPRLSRTIRHAKKTHTVLAPVFPGYVFVCFDPDSHPWRSINSTFGIKRLLGSGQTRPSPMPRSAMEPILSRCEDGVSKAPCFNFHSGQIVRITRGPFADRIGSVESLDEKGRVRVLLDILGSERSISMDRHSVGLYEL